jgi:hypothetical protein
MHGYLITSVFKFFIRELIWLALDFLHGEDIGVCSLKPRNHTIHASANGIYVMGGNTHLYSLNASKAPIR